MVPSLAKRNRNPDEFDIPALVLASQEFSGAEIEEAIISALYDAFYTRQELATTHVFASLSQTVPLAKTMAEKVTEQRNLGSLKRAGNYGGAGEAQRRLPRAFCRLPWAIGTPCSGCRTEKEAARPVETSRQPSPIQHFCILKAALLPTQMRRRSRKGVAER